MNNEKDLEQVRKNLTVGGHEISILVQPRAVSFGDSEQVVQKPRITTTLPLGDVEELVGRDKMRYQNAAIYSPRDTEEEAITAVIEKRGDMAIVNSVPEQHIGENSPLMVLATLTNTGFVSDGAIHIIGRREATTNPEV